MSKAKTGKIKETEGDSVAVNVLESDKNAARTNKIKKFFLLDRPTYVEHDDLGFGPRMADEAFEKFNAIDDTKSKVYLTWCIFIAGGGQEAYTKSLKEWKGDHPEIDVKKVIDDWKTDQRKRYETWKSFNEGKSFDDWIKENNIDPQRDFPEFIRRKAPGVKEFARLMYLFLSSMGINDAGEPLKEKCTLDELIETWPEIENEVFQDHLYGDQDHVVNKSNFGWYRDFDQSGSFYQNIIEEVIHFQNNVMKIKQIMAANEKNEAWNEANPDKPQREIRNLPDVESIDFSIGQFTFKGVTVNYSGSYPMLNDLKKANRKMSTIGLRGRVEKDEQYADASGQAVLKKEKDDKEANIYEDDRVVAYVPLTVAASVAKGYRDWCVANPSNLEACTKDTSDSYHSYWKNYTGAGKVFCYIQFKNPEQTPEIETRHGEVRLDIIALEVPGSELGELSADLAGISLWTRQYTTHPTSYTPVMKELDNHDPESAKSFKKAVDAFIKFAKNFDPKQIVSDFIAKHSTLD